MLGLHGLISKLAISWVAAFPLRQNPSLDGRY